MDINTDRKSLKILRRVSAQVRTQSLIPYYKMKGDAAAPCEYKYFPRSSPESVGLSSELISDYIAELYETKETVTDTVQIIRGGRVIGESEYYPYRFDTWHVCYSYSKSITGLAIGLLIGEGRLSVDDRVQKFFADIKPAIINPLLKNLKVRHLLNMTSGVRFNEMGSVTETDWVRCFLESVPKTEPGTAFDYNSMNSYMLSAIVTKITGLPMVDYLETRLFAPMGISHKYWTACPNGINCGGWGLYLLPEDMAKFGQLILLRGAWEGKQLVPADWIDAMCQKQADVPSAISSYSYGYQIWVSPDIDMVVLNGMYGQNTLVFRKSGIVVSLTAGNENLFHDNPAFAVTVKYFGSIEGEITPLKPDNAGYNALKELQRDYRRPDYKVSLIGRKIGVAEPLPEECADWDGTAYLYNTKEYGSTGLLPLTVQCAHNCFALGVKRVAFKVTGGRFYCRVTEGDKIYNLPVGFGKARYCDLVFGEDKYKVAVLGRFFVDEDDNNVLLVKLHFLEMGAVRALRFEPHGEVLKTRYSEKPGINFFTGSVSHFLKDIKSVPVIKDWLSSGGEDYLRFRCLPVFEPTVTGLKMR